MKADRWYDEVPLWLRCLGVRGIEGNSYRAWWGEFSATWGLALSYNVYHENATVHFHLLWGGIYIKAPMLIKQRDGTEDWHASYGFVWFGRAIHLNWRDKCKVLRLPFDWEHVRHDYLWPDGRLHHASGPREYDGPAETKERHPYTYTLRNGTVQHRIATVNGEEREWRWRWFRWLPWPRMIQRTINVAFDDEVGERTGSWKGGTIGCGYEWKHGETMLAALRRMEVERKF